MKRWLIVGVSLIACSLGFPFQTQADDSRPLYLEITETEKNLYRLILKVPPTVQSSNTPVVKTPENCAIDRNSARWKRNGEGIRWRLNLGQQYYHCASGIAGETIIISYPTFNPSTSTLVKFISLNGEEHTVILGPQETSWQVPEAETLSGVAAEYTRLGIHHIWAGLDHLLFLVCLLWIASGWRRIAITITGFTLAHSITLALSALDVVKIPLPPVEAAIALSVVFLATEIAKNQRDSLTWRYPVTVSSSFGLLHGLGFAAVLNEIGLPQTELVTGLLFFNIGVEIGQLLFAAGVIALMEFVKRICTQYITGGNLLHNLGNGFVYAIGGVSSYWLVDRCVSSFVLAGL